jgi:hypothetical protein
MHAVLDPPGETGRQARVLVLWMACLAVAVALVILTKPGPPPGLRETPRYEEELDAWRARRLRITALVGIALPGLLTFWLARRHRRGGAHARGITIDVTEDGELRIWGRGYGQRVQLSEAEVSERLVDVYSGRLGAWRQRRLRVRPKKPTAGGAREIEIGTPATESDSDMPPQGGEGDCIEIAREDYDKLVRLVRSLGPRNDERN